MKNIMHTYTNYIDTSKKKRVLAAFMTILTVLMLLTCVSFGSNFAYASINGNDKLYGETFTQREMSVKDCPNVGAQYACLMDKAGNIIYERNAYDSAKIASMTKIMTAIVTLENCSLDEQIEITQRAVDVGESSAGFWVGDKLDVKSALYALLVPSGNDAAEALSCHIGNKLINSKDDRIRKKSEEDVKQEAQDNEIDESEVKDVFIDDPEQAFCKLMNDTATEIGCTNTCFTNPHGLDNDEFKNDNQKCCAADVAKFTRYAMQKDIFRQIVGGGDVTINVLRNGQPTQLDLKSTDQLLHVFDGCIGVKTGITDDAGACFSGACIDKSDIEIYTVIMKATDESARFLDTQNLFNWYYTNKVDVKLTNTNEKIKITEDGDTNEVGVVAHISHSGWVDCTIPVTLANHNQIIPVLKNAGNVHFSLEPNNASASYKVGDKVCDIVLSQHNQEIARTELVAAKDQEAPNIFQMIGVGIDRIIRNISQQPTVAESTLVYSNEDLNNNY